MRIIGIVGALGSGKTTVGEILVKDHGFTRLSMAGPLKRGLRAMGIPEEWEKNRDLREVPQDLLCGKSWRWAAQSIGTEWGRKQIGDDLWVNLAEQDIRFARMKGIEAIVYDDIRFHNEAEMVRANGGEIWCIYGRTALRCPPRWKTLLSKLTFGLYNPLHPSERHWTEIEPDYTIHNAFDIDALKQQVAWGMAEERRNGL